MQFAAHPSFSTELPVRPEDYRSFLVINYIAHLGFVVHMLFVPVFFLLGVPILAAFNVFGSIAWFIGYRVNQKGNHSLAVTLLSSEAVVHTALAVYTVGWQAGFQNYLMAAIPFAVFNHQWRTRTIGIVSVGLLVLYCMLYAVSVRVTPVPIESWMLETIYYVNSAVTFGALGVTSYFFRQASLATERHNEDLANTDPLTYLPNRRHLWELLDAERLRSERSGRSFVIALADVDHFKKFNDAHGHHCGDAVLNHVATVMRASLRRTDSLGRWGGEEFLFIFPETHLQGAAEVLEKVRRCVEEVPCTFGDQKYHVTVTFGAANFGRGQTLERCIKAADDALYRGKDQGRNRVVTAPL